MKEIIIVFLFCLAIFYGIVLILLPFYVERIKREAIAQNKKADLIIELLRMIYDRLKKD